MSIHKPNAEIKNETECEDGELVVGFTTGTSSNPDYPPVIDVDSNDCYAKKVDFFIRENDSEHRIKKSSYYLKFGINGFIYDPWGLYSEGTQHKKANHAGKMAWSFRKVNKKCFSHYLLYLSSKNKSYLNNAEREARNG